MANPSTIAPTLTCTQCGGELHPDEGQSFLNCPYCGAAVYLDRSRVVFHWYVAPTISEQEAAGELYRWMSGSQTVKDLDKKARVTGQSFQYFPVWYIRRAGAEAVKLVPAAATSLTELGQLRLPAGDLRQYEPSLDGQSLPPSVPLEAALEWAGGEGAGIAEMALVHIPVYFFKYEYRGETYTAVVDAASGTVLANIFPEKAEIPYRLVGGVTITVYLCLALVPIIGAFTGEEPGFFTGMAICSGAGLLAAPVFFGWAFWVASKV
ncbi:MAG: hypothetical protein GX491_00175 [Chloroflexi bacterium]|nr:hypothetical protein [Chloroflexota bacterium]